MNNSNPKICIICQNAYNALRGERSGHLGGAEIQTALMARWLASHGYEVSMVTWDEGQPEGIVIDGVRILKLCAVDAGLRGLRFFHPRLTSLYSAMRQADADIYYHNSAEYVTGLAAAWCQVYRRKFVYSVAAELACDRLLPLMSNAYERVLYRFGLKRSQGVVVQTQRQRNLLKEGYNIEATILPMPCAGPLPDEFDEPSLPSQPRVVWVGRLVPGKRLEWFLDIAEQMTNVTFEIVAANVNYSPYARDLRARATLLKNVQWSENVQREQMGAVYQRASCICCTSGHEGFPNVFLEAWSWGKPVISSFDPDGLISRLQLGVKANDVPQFVNAISALTYSKETWRQLSTNARNYYLKNHLVDNAMFGFDQLFRLILQEVFPLP